MWDAISVAIIFVRRLTKIYKWHKNRNWNFKSTDTEDDLLQNVKLIRIKNDKIIRTMIKWVVHPKKKATSYIFTRFCALDSKAVEINC